jgi:hypothetical protein
VFVVKRLMVDIIGLMMLAEGEPKPHRRRTEATCGAPVARFGIWVGPFQLYIICDQLNFHNNLASDIIQLLKWSMN